MADDTFGDVVVLFPYIGAVTETGESCMEWPRGLMWAVLTRTRIATVLSDSVNEWKEKNMKIESSR